HGSALAGDLPRERTDLEHEGVPGRVPLQGRRRDGGRRQRARGDLVARIGHSTGPRRRTRRGPAMFQRSTRDPRARRHSRYAGTPASRIAKPITLFAGNLYSVLITTSALTTTNASVVHGCPGVANAGAATPAARSLRRSVNRLAAARPKKIQSTDTT